MAKLKLILAMLIFGTIGIFVKYIPLSSAVIALVRGLVGTLFLVGVMGISRRKLSLEAIRRNLPQLLFSGIAIGFNWILLFEAYRYTTVATATLCYYLAPAFVILVSPFLLKEKLTWVKILCVAGTLTGMVFVSGVLGSSSQGSGMRGILLGVGAAAFYASVVITNQFLKDISSYESTIMQLAAAAAVLLPYVLLTEDFSAMTLTWQGGLLLLAVGVVHTGVGYWLYFSSMAELDSQTVAIFSYLDPVTAILLSALLLGERLTAGTVLGAALILGSTLFSELAGEKAWNK